MAPINMYQETLQASIEESKKVVEEYKTFCLSKGVRPLFMFFFKQFSMDYIIFLSVLVMGITVS